MATKLKLVIGFGAALVLLMTGPATAAHASVGSGGPGQTHTAGSSPDQHQAVVSLEQSPYGPVLVVGGLGAGYHPADPSTKPPTPAGYNFPPGSSLYFLSSDPLTDGQGTYQPACTTIAYPPHNGPCTSTASAEFRRVACADHERATGRRPGSRCQVARDGVPR